MLEQPPETYYEELEESGDFFEPAVKVIFVSRSGVSRVDGETTNSQNTSTYVTSSVPYVDGHSRERFSVQPDLLDDIEFAEAVDSKIDE